MNKDTFEAALKLQLALKEINDNEPWTKLFQDIQSIEYMPDGYVQIVDDQMARGYHYTEYYTIPFEQLELLKTTNDIEKFNQ